MTHHVHGIGRSITTLHGLAGLDRADPADPRLPDAFVGSLGFGATLFVAVLIAQTDRPSWGVSLAVMAMTVTAVSWLCRPIPSVFVAICGWLALNGIVVNGDGRLHWSGRDDLIRVAILVVGSFTASVARALIIRHSSKARTAARMRHLQVISRGEPHA